jgi:hypothetical protein
MRFLILDSGGLHISTAVKLGKDGHDVWYYCPWQSAYPKFIDGAPGTGIPEIMKVLDYGPYLDEADCIVFPDVGLGELAHFLRSKGYNVFGAGLGEILEQDRGKSVEVMKSLGIACPETYVVTGVDAALEKLSELFSLTETNQSSTGKYFIKLNVWRGSFESFPAENLDIAEFMFDSLKTSMGPYAHSVPIIIQKTVEGIETGGDLFFSGKEFIKPYMVGFEVGGSYIGYLTNDMGPFAEDMKKMEKYLSSVNYRGAFSFECFYDGSRCSYIDFTQRFPMPLGMLYAEYADDFGALLYEIASGKATSSHLPTGQFLGCMDVTTEEAISKWIPLNAGENTRFVRYMMDQGKAFAVPGIGWVATCLAQGNSMEEIEKKLNDEGDKCNIFFAGYNDKFVQDIREKYIEPLKELGFDFDALTNQAPPTIESRHPLQSRRQKVIQEKKEFDPLDELREIREMVDKPVKPLRDQVKHICEDKSVVKLFQTPVDHYGIPKV